MGAANEGQEDFYLQCEEPWVYKLLIAAAGWFGAYTFIMRGGIFCNAQTANVVLFAIALGTRDWQNALYLTLPISAYFLGAFLSESLGRRVKRFQFLRWDTLLIAIEIFVVIGLGLLPANAPDQICQVALNFICSMQFNTFRQVRGVPASTTFVTNHIRQVGANLSVYLRKKDARSERRLRVHSAMLLYFLIGGIVGSINIEIFAYKGIWGSAIILLIIFIRLAYADRVLEKEMLHLVPRGH
ncbi:MAG: YoaK family protein [Peptoniphilus sp.]|nr:YoaK family protein [Peptoniphilus sp.]MDD7362666.1 YoaK family protein [Bacillota bacterium]MDY6044935.1 YoaK family protein [Peptoniphilus sp.]